MAGKRLVIPSVSGIGMEGVPTGVVMFLQAVQDALSLLDSSVLYKTDADVNVQDMSLRGLAAQGQSAVVGGFDAASGVDFRQLVQETKALHADMQRLHAAVKELAAKVSGRQ